MKIFINPGHSVNPNEDPGTCHFGLREADIALRIGQRVENYLRAVGYEVKLFQYDSLKGICDDANAWGADLFVSIHCNSAEDSDANGTETFYARDSVAGRSLAQRIQNQIVKSLPLRDRKVGEAGFAVLVWTDCPAVLVETAFLSNANEAKLLIEREDDFARAIARGITDYTSEVNPLPDTVDIKTNSAERITSHFNASEFVCHCCGRGSVDQRLIELLEELREKAGNVPIHVNCGYRCPKHNAEVGGVPNSQHVLGNAADITIPKIPYNRARKLVESIDFDGTGFYPPLEIGGAWFIHVDVRNGGIGSHIVWEE